MNHQEAISFPGCATWRKSSRSLSEGQCIEVTFTLGRIFTRDSKNSNGPTLSVIRTEWTAFLNALKKGELDPH
jgi:hypothetical protein